jgi:hypothetical protein
MNFTRRLKALERQIQTSPEPIRLVVTYVGDNEPTDLQKATCHRRLLANGTFYEVVTLNGTGDGISREDLYRFVAKFPIEPDRRSLGR